MTDTQSPRPPAECATLDRAAALVEGADTLIVAAGAGIGVDSGLPDFRGNDGFWKVYPALAESALESTQVAGEIVAPTGFGHPSSLNALKFDIPLRLAEAQSQPKCHLQHGA